MRRSLAGLLVAAGVAFGNAAASAQPASWDAAWVGGWNSGLGTQVVIAGGKVIGFFWRGAYFTIENSTAVADGEPVTFSWPDGEALVRSHPDGGLMIVVRERGQPETGFPLARQ